MIVLACSDLHGSYQVYEWLARVATARRPSVLILAGDLFGFPDGYDTIEAAQAADGRMASALLGALQVPVLYVMGNDDWVEWDPAEDTIQPIHGRRLTLGDFRFVGYQYTPPFVGSMHEKPEAEIRADLARVKFLLDERTVFVTHGPARHVLDQTAGGDHVGGDALSEVFRRSGIHFNVAAAAQRRAMLIDLGNMTHEILEG